MADMIRRADVVVVLINLTTEPLSQYEDTMAMLESFRIYPENAEVPDG